MLHVHTRQSGGEVLTTGNSGDSKSLQHIEPLWNQLTFVVT